MATDLNGMLASRRLRRDGASPPSGIHEQLFRPEALQRRFEVAQPRAVSLMPVSWVVLSALLVGMSVFALTLLLTGNFARKETVTGLLKPSGGDVAIRVDRGGISSSVFVAEGSLVRKGAPLFDIQTQTALLDGRMPSDELNAMLQAQALNSEREAEARQREAIAELAKLSQEERSGLQLIARLSQQHVVAQERYRLAQENAARTADLFERGLATKQEADRRKDLELLAKLEIAQLATERARALSAQANFRPEGDRLRARIAGEKAQADMARGQIAERELSTNQGRGIRITAPISGVVSGLRLSRGQAVQPGDPAMSIIPPHVRLIAELYVPSQAIGFVARGQTVKLRYQAYPFQKFGSATGRIASVSQGAQKIADIALLGGQDGAYYIVKVALDRQSLSAFGTDHPLKPGMTLSADIVLEKRSFLEWLFEPVFSSSGRLL